ncbi:MAG: hypothetical protein ACYCX5_11180, partial [Coriobacteriia bacterium]
MNINTRAAITAGVAVFLMGTVAFASGAPFAQRPAPNELPVIRTDRPVEAIGLPTSSTPPAVTNPSAEPSRGSEPAEPAEPAESEQGPTQTDDDTHEVIEPEVRDEGPDSSDSDSSDSDSSDSDSSDSDSSDSDSSDSDSSDS